MKVCSYNEKSDKWLQALLLLFAFSFPLSRAASSIFSVIFILYFIYCIVYIKKEVISIIKMPFSIVILIFIVYLFISSSWSHDKVYSLEIFIHYYLRWLAIFGIALIVLKNKKMEERAISAFLLGMFVSEVLSYGMYYELWTINGHGKNYPTPFMSHIEYSLFIAITALILLNRIFSNRYSNITKLAMGIFFITAVTNLFIGIGRTGQIAFLIGIFVSFFIHYRPSIKSILSISLMATVLFGSAYIFNDHFKTRVNAAIQDFGSIEVGKYNNSIGLRLLQYPVTWKIFLKEPIFGVGLGSRSQAVAQLFKRRELNYQGHVKKFLIHYHSHNQFLQTLIETGLIGLALSILIFFCLLRLKSNNPEINELSILFTVVFFIASLFEPMWIKQFSGTLFIFMSGVILGSSSYKKNNLVIKYD